MILVLGTLLIYLECLTGRQVTVWKYFMRAALLHLGSDSAWSFGHWEQAKECPCRPDTLASRLVGQWLCFHSSVGCVWIIVPNFILLRNSHAEKYDLVLLIGLLVLLGYFKAFMGDDVDKANSTLHVFSTLNFAKCFHIHYLILLSIELWGLETQRLPSFYGWDLKFRCLMVN